MSDSSTVEAMVLVAPVAPTDEPGASTVETTAPLALTAEPGAYIVFLFCILPYINCQRD